MDNAQANYFRQMADIRKKVFTPEMGGYLAGYYQETAAANLKSYQDLEPKVTDSYNELMAIRDIALEAQKNGSGWYYYKNKYHKTSNLIDKEGNLRDLNDIVRSQQWYSTHQGKMMPGRVGSVVQDYQKNKSEYDAAAEAHKKYQKLYDEYMTQVAADNERRHGEFLKQQQEILAAGQATAYRGATYTEKPK